MALPPDNPSQDRLSPRIPPRVSPSQCDRKRPFHDRTAAVSERRAKNPHVDAESALRISSVIRLWTGVSDLVGYLSRSLVVRRRKRDHRVAPGSCPDLSTECRWPLCIMTYEVSASRMNLDCGGIQMLTRARSSKLYQIPEKPPILQAMTP